MKQLLTLAALLLASLVSLYAADVPPTTAPGKPSNQTAPGAAATESALDQQSQKKLKRAHHLAEKSANTEFLNSPQGIAFKNLIASTDQEVNAVYEKYLNICRENPATEKGKQLRAERNRQLQLLEQKRGQAEADYEKLKESSPAYRAMLAAHLKSELKQVKGKLKTKAAVEEDDK